MAESAPLYKFDVCIYKNDSISTEEFTKYMKETYLPKASAIVKRHGLLQFAIVCCSSLPHPQSHGRYQNSRSFIHN